MTQSWPENVLSFAQPFMGVNGLGMGMHPPTIGRGMQCRSSPLAATNLCQSCHIQLSVDSSCYSSCMNGDIWRWHIVLHTVTATVRGTLSSASSVADLRSDRGIGANESTASIHWSLSGIYVGSWKDGCRYDPRSKQMICYQTACYSPGLLWSLLFLLLSPQPAWYKRMIDVVFYSFIEEQHLATLIYGTDNADLVSERL